MKTSASPKPVSAAKVVEHLGQSEPASLLAPSTTAASRSEMETTIPPCAKPFDHWKPLGGGAEHDIFRRFKILATEEEAFLIYWAKKSSGKGILSHDETGTLIFRISSANISDLADMHIGRSDGPDHKAQWLHVYDNEGVSWLTQSTKTNQASSSIDVRNLVLASNIVGRYGPSGLTVEEVGARYQWLGTKM